MYSSVTFYNHFGNGDIFESREFIKEIMSSIPANEYLYAHGKSKKILLDIAGLSQIEVTPEMEIRKQLYEKDGTLFVNTWIGITGKYVLPGYACTLEKLIEMYNDTFRGVHSFDKPPLEYLPSLDYSFYPISCQVSHERDWVYVSNGNVHSNQATNFDFDPVLEQLSALYQNKVFFVTNPTSVSKVNVVDANEFVGVTNAFNLNELSSLSRYCDVIIGRNSGPQVFTWTKGNCMTQKKNITFSHTSECRHFVYTTPIVMEKHWSPATNTAGIVDFIRSVL